MVALSGCDAPVAVKLGQPSLSESDSSASRTANKPSWEAGVILAGRAGYQCLSLEAIGLKQSDEVVSVTSSCDCIAPSLVKYAASESANASGNLLQYIDESTAYHNHFADSDSSTGLAASPPANLGVIFELTLADGSTHEFTVNFLHTHLAEQTSADEEYPQ